MLKKLIIRKTMLLVLTVLVAVCSSWAQGIVGKDVFPSFSQPIKYPAMTPDGNCMVFLGGEENAVRAYESYRKNGQWSQPVPFEYVNRLIEQSKHEVGGFSFNHDGNELYFHAKLSGNVFGIYCARRTKDGWSEPQRLKLPSGLEADNLFSPTISSNNRTIFVLRTKPAEAKKKETCKELLLFEKNREGEWLGPKYIPKEFNTGCQETPFISADNNSLYFSSKRVDIDKNTGKKIADDDSYNIYFARRIDENNWYYPVYMATVNSDFDNLSPMVNSAGDYFINNSKTSKKQPAKIYTLPLPADKKPEQTFVVKGAITDLYSKEPVEAKISVQNAITSVLQGEFETNYEGKYSIILTQGTFYKLDFSKAGYSHTYYYKDLNVSGF